MIFFILILIASGEVNSLPIPCMEDSQCPDNFFCEVSNHVCRKCLDCEELNRSPQLQSHTMIMPNCLKFDFECGPCVKGWILRRIDHGSECVPLESDKKHFLHKFYIWLGCAGAAVGFLLTALFLHVYQNTTIIKIVNYYIPIPETTAKTGIPQ